MSSEKRTVAILQSNYIPWKGYFDIIAASDLFVLYDDVQYTKRDWRNRNKIKTEAGLKWLTIPVEVKGKYHQKINETKINEADWNKKHWNTLRHTYKQSAHFKEIEPFLAKLYLEDVDGVELLSEVNMIFLRAICDKLGIDTPIVWSSEFDLDDGKTERLHSICMQAEATTYLSGPAAQGYLDESVFNADGMAVEWMSYEGYKEYPQLFGDFEHGVSIVDLLFNTGTDARKFMKY